MPFNHRNTFNCTVHNKNNMQQLKEFDQDSCDVRSTDNRINIRTERSKIKTTHKQSAPILFSHYANNDTHAASLTFFLSNINAQKTRSSFSFSCSLSSLSTSKNERNNQLLSEIRLKAKMFQIFIIKMLEICSCERSLGRQRHSENEKTCSASQVNANQPLNFVEFQKFCFKITSADKISVIRYVVCVCFCLFSRVLHFALVRLC